MQQICIYFWRDATGHELDCLIGTGRGAVPVEIKSGQTIATDFFKELNFWHAKANQPEGAVGYLVYGRNENQERTKPTVLSWRSAGNLIKKL